MTLPSEKPLPTVLIVDDNDILRTVYAGRLLGTANVLHAATGSEADAHVDRHVKGHAAIDVIVWDGMLPDRENTSVSSISRAREVGFPGHRMIANSSSEELCRHMLDAGCGHSVAGQKGAGSPHAGLWTILPQLLAADVPATTPAARAQPRPPVLRA